MVNQNNYKIWKKAKKIIPGGNMLISKRPPRFLEKKYPIYFKKCKDSFVWDINNKKYLDMYLMGVGTNILGYNNTYVNNAVKRVIDNGNTSSLNSVEDLKLSNELLKINKWADMVKLARTGGEANAIAVRIVRASTNRDLILFCGYHGWHDWYLAANLLHKDNLDSHLFPNLSVSGIPKKLKGSSISVNFNDVKKIKLLGSKYKKRIAAIKIEAQRNDPPTKEFLKEIENIRNKYGAKLIVDECTSGFRENFGGIYKKFDIKPDIAIFGKSLGNGFPITAILGKKKIMLNADKTFISSTFWSERIGTTAALATLKKMKTLKTWSKISKKGKFIKKRWMEFSKIYDLPLIITGLDALPKFEFKNKNNEILKNFILYEMLKKNILAKNVIYLSISHSDEQIKKYLNNLKKIFYKIKKNQLDHHNINNFYSKKLQITDIKLKRFN